MLPLQAFGLRGRLPRDQNLRQPLPQPDRFTLQLRRPDRLFVQLRQIIQQRLQAFHLIIHALQ